MRDILAVLMIARGWVPSALLCTIATAAGACGSNLGSPSASTTTTTTTVPPGSTSTTTSQSTTSIPITPTVNQYLGTYNVIVIKVSDDGCSFPTPPPSALTLSANSDGSNFAAGISDRGSVRIYRGQIQFNGDFSGSGSGPIPGARFRTLHEFRGSIGGRTNGTTISARETITITVGCPDNQNHDVVLALDGSR